MIHFHCGIIHVNRELVHFLTLFNHCINGSSSVFHFVKTREFLHGWSKNGISHRVRKRSKDACHDGFLFVEQFASFIDEVCLLIIFPRLFLHFHTICPLVCGWKERNHETSSALERPQLSHCPLSFIPHNRVVHPSLDFSHVV